MKKLFMKRVIVTLLLASWCMQPVFAADQLIMTKDETLSNGLSNVTVDNNGTGGAIVNNGFNLTVNGGSFENNLLKNENGAAFGGAIHQSGGSLSLDGVSFIDNIVKATDQKYDGWDGTDSPSGAAIFITGTTSQNIITNSTFTNNQALNINDNGQSNGGAIFAQSNNNLTITGSTFTSNSSKNRGGAVYNGDSNINIENTQFSKNESASGGAIYMLEASNAPQKTVVTTDSKTTFSENKAITGNGGAIVSYDGEVNVNGSTFTGNQAVNGKGGAIANTNWQSQGTVNINGGSTFTGNTAAQSGGAVYSEGIVNVDTESGDVTFSENTADGKANDIALSGTADKTSQLNITGSKNTLSVNAISGNENSAIQKSGSNTFAINGDSSSFKGSFLQSSGTTNVNTGAKFFGGSNNINSGELNVNGGEIVAGSSTSLGDSAEMKLDNNASVSGAVSMGNGSKITINSDSATSANSTVAITGAITGTSGEITLEGGNLVINGSSNNQSGFSGNFTQTAGTTTVSNGATFFAGQNVIQGGEFIFNNGKLANDVEINGDALLTIVGDKTFNGNEMTVDGQSYSFVLKDADFTGSDTKIDTTADNLSADIEFSNGAGIGASADITLTKSADSTGRLTMADGAVSEGGSVTLTEGTSFDITASDFDLNTDISSASGIGEVNVKNTVQTLDINSDNSAFNGIYNQDAGTVTVNNGAKFFNGTNNIKAGSVIFKNGSFLNGNNILTNTAAMVIEGGANLSADSVVNLSGTDSSLSFASGGTYTLDSSSLTVTGSGNINNEGTLNINNGAKVSGFNGKFTQNAGNTVVDNTEFFKGTNNINKGSVEFKNNAVVSGQNTLSNDASFVVNGGSSFAQGASVNLNSAASHLDFNSAASTETALSIALQGVEGSTVNKEGEGSLNITASQSGFGGKFVQKNGITNVSSDFFNSAEIQNGVLNILANSNISNSAIALAADADMNILADSDINKTITGNGDIFVGSDSVSPTVNINADQTAFVGTYTQNAGTVNVSNGFFSKTNNILGGILNFNKADSVLKGTNKIGGGAKDAKVTLSNGAQIDSNASVTLAERGTLEFADSAARELNTAVQGTAGTVAKTGTGDLIVKENQDSFTGTFNQSNGNTTVDGAKFFGGKNNINKGSLTLNNGASLANGSTTNLAGGTSMDVNSGSSIDGNVVMNAQSSININKDAASDVTISGNISSNTIANAADQQITISNGSLTISGDQSGYKGTFNQEDGTTVTVVDGGVFFGGDNFVKGGIFNFNQGAELSSDVTITNKNTQLNIFGSDKVLDGNKLVVNDGWGFVLKDALFSGSDALVKEGTFSDGHITFENQGGIAQDADITLGNGGTFTMSAGSVANSGSLKMDKGSNFEVVSDLTLNTNISSVNKNDGTVTIKKADASSSAPNVIVASDNSAFTGSYKQQDGSEVTVTGKFFNGTNTIDNSKLTFENGSSLNGNNIFSNASELVINGGTNTSSDSKIVLNDTSSMSLNGADLTLNSQISGSAKINNNLTGTFTVTGDNSAFSGNYTQTSSITVVDGGIFFGGTNTINGGSVEFVNNATLAGTNEIGDAVMTINNGTKYHGGTSVNLNNSNAKLVLNNSDTSNSMKIDGLTITGTDGTVRKTGKGTLDVSSKLSDLTNSIEEGRLNMMTGSTLAGSNIIKNGAELVINDGVNKGSSTVTLEDGSVLTLNPAESKRINLSDYAISASGTNTQINKSGLGELIVDKTNSITGNGNTYTGKFNQTEGITTVTGNFFGGANTITGGVLNFEDGSTILDSSSIALGSNAVMNFNGSSDQTLGVSISGVTDNFGSINKTGTGTLNINADQSAFKGNYVQQKGTTVVENGSLFGGENTIKGGTVEMKDNSSLASGSSLKLENGTTVNIVNSGAQHSTTSTGSAGIPNKTGNETVLSGTISSVIEPGKEGEYQSNINVSGENTYLVIDGDMSKYTGNYTQSDGATTEVTSNGIFFGGYSDITDGHFIFRDGAQLVEDVYISGDNVHLAFGDGSKDYKIEDGNKVYYYDSLGNRSENAFILETVTLTDSLYTGSGDLTVGKLTFGKNGGFASDADYTLKNSSNPDKTTTIIMKDGSVAQDGSKLAMEDNTVLNITASYLEEDDKSTGKNGTFGMDISGKGFINVYQDNATDAPKFTIISDNSLFEGQYHQLEGEITVSGKDSDNLAHFFGGTNLIDGGSVTFAANSVVEGYNQISGGGVFNLADGAVINKDDENTAIVMNGGNLNITNNTDDVDLNISIGDTGAQGSVIEKTGAGKLVISADQHGYKGEYKQTGDGTTVINAGNTFFGGKNTISAGIVDATAGDSVDNAAILTGENIIDGNGTIKIGDFTNTSNLTDNKITLNSDSAVLELQSTENNNKNLDVSFNVTGNGVVLHSGEGALNLYNAGASDLFENFTGTFKQENASLGADQKLITNVFGKFFKNSEIKNGTLNLKNGAELVEGGTTKIVSGANLNIGTIKDDTTVDPVKFDDNSVVNIKGSIEGDGNVDVSQGKTTIAGSSDNSAFVGNYTQTGGTVTAEGGSTFFGGTNLINKGKLVFKKQANLTTNKNVELKGKTDFTGKTINDSAVVDLDGRTDAKFAGGTLYVDNKTTEGFVFTDGVLENATLTGSQEIGDGAVVTLKGGSGFASGADVSIKDSSQVILGSGSIAAQNSTIDIENGSKLTLVSSSPLEFHSIASGSGDITVEKDFRETFAPNVNIYGDQSGFAGKYYQDAGSVTVKSGSTFFGGDNEITGIKIVDDSDPTKVIKETSGDLHLEKGSYLGSDIHVTNSDKTANAGVSTPHGRVFVEDKIFNSKGEEMTDISELINDNDLHYNNILNPDGTLDTDSLKQIHIENGGLILSNGTIFETPDGTAVFERKDGGIIDIGFSNNTGVNGDILLKRDTMLSYGDNAYIKDDSILTMEDTAILNFINDNAVINYNPVIKGGGSIYKEGLAATNISSAIDMIGEVNVKEGALNFTTKDKVIFDSGTDLRQTGNLTVGSGSSNAIFTSSAKNTAFAGDVKADAQDGTQSVINIAGDFDVLGNFIANNTSIWLPGHTEIDGNLALSGDSSLNLIGNSANKILVGGDMIVENMKDGVLPIKFDYDPRANAMDQIIIDGDYQSQLPILIGGINFVTSPRDYQFNLDATTLIQANGGDTPTYTATDFYTNAAMGRYHMSNGGGGPILTGTLAYLNPQQYRGQVATIASWQNQLVVNNMLFDHMDILTRQLMEQEKTANKYAAAYPQFAPYQYDLKGGSLWYKAYGNFERLSMTKGLSVGNNAYGSLIGADFPLINLKNGWKLVPTAYIGYNGAHQTFNGVSMYQNGAQIGMMGTAYKGNLITSLLAYGGGYANDMSVRGEFGSGSDTTGNWFAGVASKTAYNIHLPKDFIFQPTILASYNAFGNQNWGSNFGVLSMNSGMLNGINIAPGFNLIWNKKTFDIYATAQMVYNIMGGVDGRAGNIDLGYVRMRHSYFEYGLGVSKSFKDRFKGYLQFTIRNGGRTGIGFSGGLQWKIGK